MQQKEANKINKNHGIIKALLFMISNSLLTDI